MTTPSAKLRDRPFRPRLALLAVLLFGARVASANPPGASEPADHDDDPVTFTISGGASLGVFEAGLAWGVVRFLQEAHTGEFRPAHFRPRLATVTGASAGAVNAFLAATFWCERPDRRGNVDSNLLLDAWLDLDASALLPRGYEGYGVGDGLLAAAPLERVGRMLRTIVFGPGADGRFEPGCRVPIGITVTPFEPRLRDVAGLSASTRRLVLPWRLEVGAEGEVTVRRQALPGAEVEDDVLVLDGIPGPGEAEPFRPEVVVEALLASTAVPVAFAPRRLCAHSPAGVEPSPCRLYVDGGIFDNAPLGLEADLAEGAVGGRLLHPITSFLVDPERRRLGLPAPESVADATPATLTSQLRLFQNLLGAARSAELARAASSRGWNRTTERLVRGASGVAVEIAELYAASAPAAAPDQEDRISKPGLQGHVDRATFGRALAGCLERLTAGADGGQAPCTRDVLALELSSAVPGTEPLSPEEVIGLAERLAAFLRIVPARSAAERGSPGPAVRQRALQVPAFMAAAAFLFLADEVQRISASGMPDPELRRFRSAVLEPVRRSGAAFGLFDLVLRERFDEQLANVARVAPPSVADAVQRAREGLAGSVRGGGFDADVIAAATAASADAVARGAWDAAAATAAWRGVRQVLEARTRALELSARLAVLRRDANALAEGDRPEHTLYLSSRFAPLAGSQLAGFAAFLDRPLRRYDYYAGVYEAVHLLAVGMCTNEPPVEGGEEPVRLQSDPAELDLNQPATQRCLGQAMRHVVDALGLRASPQASRVVATLARLELAAWLGSSTRERLLRAEPSWAWMDDLGGPPPGDPVVAVLAALTAGKALCRSGDTEALCPAELPFEDFLAALEAQGYRPTSPTMVAAMRDPSAWWAEVLARLSDRALAVERSAASSPGPMSDTISAALGVASLLSHRAAMRGPTPRFILDPSTIPGPTPDGHGGELWAVLSHVVPYRLSLDFAHGGFGAAWIEPELRLAPWLSVQSTLEEIGYRSGTGWTSAAGGLVVAHAAGLSVGAGPRAWFDWRGGSGLGAEARVAVLQDRLAFGFGVRDARPGARDRGWFLTVSVADLNGLFFWLSPRGPGGRTESPSSVVR